MHQPQSVEAVEARCRLTRSHENPHTLVHAGTPMRFSVAVYMGLAVRSNAALVTPRTHPTCATP